MKISILITTFNRVELLKKSLNSALNQDYENLEIIVSDDNSTDDTSEYLKSITDKRLKVITNKTHAQSPNGNKNNAFDAATGDYVCLLDDDDELYLNAISECVKFIKMGYKCVFADCICEENGVITNKISGKNPYKISCEMSKIDYHCGRISGEYFKLFSREFIDDFRFDEASFGGENELYIRFFESPVFYHKTPLYIYRINRADSATKNAIKHAKKVAHAYIKTANLCYEIAIKHERKFLAMQYKNAAYYAKIAGCYALMYRCIFKSLSIKFSKEAFIFLLLSPLPSVFLPILSRIRVKIKQKFKI
ncbi:glycosyl transferase [Campylobacter mucosalis]|uniref:glycosyltransferase family 2 protein n=1 Tax=Campylobacter mucosalis TaxID=202 RepID=UPI0004DAC89A|nr:glycosyltransferase [Campylobacter mucosalis]KEA45613.1 glycosyl transferase [Campylobacter mucosalis]QKF62479.1 GalNAc5-diNAcBac-PP-undecaprenol beta-1,3-glucosyltransferase [Campylobacter mucosalis]